MLPWTIGPEPFPPVIDAITEDMSLVRRWECTTAACRTTVRTGLRVLCRRT